MSLWPEVVRSVDSVEGVCGTLLNCAVLYLVWHRKQSTELLTYRICLTVISLEGLLLSAVVVALSNTVHLFHPDAYLVIVYGPIASFSEMPNTTPFLFHSLIIVLWEFLVIFSLYPTLGTFMLIPGPCLLHYLTLCKPHISKTLRLFLSYGPCIAMVLWATPYYLSSHTSDRFTALVREVHHTEPTDRFVTLGMKLMPSEEHPKAMINFAFECVFPSYLISYGTFAITAMKCHSYLSAIDIAFSEKTRAMHRRFLIMLALQNLLPLVVLAIPIGIFCVALIGGLKVGLVTLVVSFSCWTLPTVQVRLALSEIWVTRGSVSLVFVLRLNKNSSSDSGKTSSQARKITIKRHEN